MKLEILAPVFLGPRGYIPGSVADVPEIIAATWIEKRLARKMDGSAPQAAAVVAPQVPEHKTFDVRARVAELRQDCTVAELRKMYEEVLGAKPPRGSHEEDLANAIAATEAKGR